MGPVEIVIIGLGGVAVLIVLALVFMQLNKRAAEPYQPPAPQLGSAPARPQPAASVNVKRNWLEGVEGSVQGKTYHLGSREGTIGRKVGNYIQIIDDNISRVHVKFSGQGQGATITDQKSNIGTFVNDEKLTPGVAHMLKEGDRLKIGQAVFVFHGQANFPVNHGLTEAKIAGQAQMKKTEALGVLNWKQEVSDALMKAGGDKAKAAEIMGVPQEVYEKMLDQAKDS